METRTYNVYKFSELSDKAKEHALDYFRQQAFNYSYDWEFVYEDADKVAEILGIYIDRRRNGKEPSIWFSGFWSQGDGASFDGTYRYAKGALQAIKAYAPQDTELHRIAKELQEIQRRNFYRLYASIKTNDRYHTLSVDVEDSEDRYRDIGDAEDVISECMNDFASWIYERLEKEYEYQTSDEYITENIEANDYSFDENGNLE